MQYPTVHVRPCRECHMHVWHNPACSRSDGFQLQPVHPPPEARATAGSATGSLESGGTTPKRSEALGNPEWRADMEHVWRARQGRKLASLRKRARRHGARVEWLRRFTERGTEDEKAEAEAQLRRARASERWAEDRARSLAMERGAVLDACGGRWRTIACGCGHREVEVGCEHPMLCERCRRRHFRRHRRKLARTLDAHVRAAVGAWGVRGGRRVAMRPGVYLVTLTGPPSGDLVRDREQLGKAVRKLVDHGTRHGWWSAYALTWEVAEGGEGRAGQGHVHAHVACVSSWIPYTSAEVHGPRVRGTRAATLQRAGMGLHEVWRRAMPGALVVDVQAPGKRTKDADGHVRQPPTAASAAFYLSKYVTKGIDPELLEGAKAGEALVAFYARRKYTCSRYFWRPLRDRESRCPCCRKTWRLVGHPTGLQHHAPGAVLSAAARALGADCSTVAPQKLLSLRPP